MLIKVRLSLSLISYALCHEDMMGSGGITPLVTISALDGGERLASGPDALPPGKNPPVPTEEEKGWSPESVWMRSSY
jgi:hypothetical protein